MSLSKRNCGEYEVAIAEKECDIVEKFLEDIPNVTVTGADATSTILK